MLLAFLLIITSCNGYINRLITHRSSYVSKFNLYSTNNADLQTPPNMNLNDNKEEDDLPIEQDPDLKLALSQLKPFLEIAGPFFKEDKVARNSLIGVVALTLLNSGISVSFSYISRDFYNALNGRNEDLFYEKIQLFFGALVIAVPVSVYYRFLREKLSLYWREALTTRVLDQYYENRTFYVMETLQEIDNPDQRIADDVRAFTRTSLDFFIAIFTSLVDLASFSAILLNIFPGLFVAIIAYAGLGSIVTTNLGRSLVSKNYQSLRKEADFRFSLIRTRENAEAIAFYDPDAKLERDNLKTLFSKVLENQMEIIKTQRNLEVFTTAYRYVPQVLPSLIVAPLYFQHKVELGAISQSYGAFNHILGDFSIIINSFESLSAFSAGLSRLTLFMDQIQIGGWRQGGTGESSMADIITNLNEEDSSNQLNVDKNNNLFANQKNIAGRNIDNLDIIDGYCGGIDLCLREPQELLSACNNFNLATNIDTCPLLVCSNLCVRTPDASRVIIGCESNAGVDMCVEKGDRIIIVGPSGCGKSSLVRAISGLWQRGSGEVAWSSELHVSSSNGIGSSSSSSSSSDAVVEDEREENVFDDIGAPSSVFFLPQRPYNLLGSLRSQIMYPAIGHIGTSPEVVQTSTRIDSNRGMGIATGVRNMEEDTYLLDILDKVRLGGLASRMGGGDANAGLDVCEDWTKMLSLGEQQRLAFARVLYNQPSVVVLDESTSALDLDSEKAMYDLLHHDLQATYVSIGHRPSLLKYHDKKIVMEGVGFSGALAVETIVDKDASTLIS